MVKKILIIALPGIGDTLLATPMMEILRKSFPDAKISALVMFRGSYEVLEKNPNLDKVLYWNFLGEGMLRSLNFILKLRKEKFDISITTYPSNRKEYNLISYIIGARKRLAHRYNHLFYRNLGFSNTDVIQEDEKIHNVEENIRLLSLIGINKNNWGKPCIYLTEEDEEFAKKWLKMRNLEDKPIIGMHAGTARFKNQIMRRWDPQKFGNLGRELVKEGKDILIFGGNDEEKLKRAIKEQIGDRAWAVSNTMMRETAALIKNCQVFVSADSSLMHTAASLDVPCVAIFGPTNPQWVRPYRVNHIIIRKDIPCSPCFYYSPRPLTCKFGDFRCVKSISVEEVLEGIHNLISTKSGDKAKRND